MNRHPTPYYFLLALSGGCSQESVPGESVDCYPICDALYPDVEDWHFEDDEDPDLGWCVCELGDTETISIPVNVERDND